MKKKFDFENMCWGDIVYSIPWYLCVLGLIMIGSGGLIALIISSFSVVTKIILIGIYSIVVGAIWGTVREF